MTELKKIRPGVIPHHTRSGNAEREGEQKNSPEQEGEESARASMQQPLELQEKCYAKAR